jgi:hypothetical protein
MSSYNEFLIKYKEKFAKLDEMDVDGVLSLKMNEFYYEDKMLEKNLQDIVSSIIKLDEYEVTDQIPFLVIFG